LGGIGFSDTIPNITMALTFEWGTNKAKRNLAKHGIIFEESSTVFGDPHWLIVLNALAISNAF